MRTWLPVDDVLPALVAALRESGSVVLEAAPGAGKTTRVPPALLDAGLAGNGEIVVLEPRRLAARAAARRVAYERGETVGETVGFQVRFEEARSARTRIRFVTEGILTRQLLGDPLLRGVGAVVLDEFHERHLHADVALALLLRLQREPRPDLKLVVMSATLDAAGLAAHLGCPVVRSEGRRFPVEIEHLERPDDRRLGDQVAAAVRKLTVPQTEGDVLVFLPGAAEIRHAAQACSELAAHRNLLVLPLHGDLPAAEQDRALLAGPQRKVILSTNVAETSVTVEGVRAVVDSGLARIAAASPWTGLSSLTVSRISQASAVQRAGRAGRTAPGRALRLFTRQDFESRPAQHAPELLRLDLAELVLDLAAAGLAPDTLPWLDEPPTAALEAARALLVRLGALDRQGKPTPLGLRCAAFPLHPRLSRLVLEADARGVGRDGCAAAALLSEREARIAGGRAGEAPTGASDLIELLDRAAREQGRSSRAQAQLERALARTRTNPPTPSPLRGAARDEALGLAVLAAFPDRVGQRRAPGADEVVLALGGSARLLRESAVRDAQLLVAIDAASTGPGRGGPVQIRLASAIEPEWLLALETDLLTHHEEVLFNPERGRVEVRTQLRYGALVLEEGRRAPRQDDAHEREECARLLLAAARAAGLPPPEELERLRARLDLLARHCPDAGLPPPDGAELEAPLRAACADATTLAELARADLIAAAIASLGPAAARALATLAPEHIVLPGGRKVRVEYVVGQPPAVHSRLQDFFGEARSPTVAGGRVPLVVHLLAPNGRAQQITSDLAGFWERHYPAVRRELMRRYPRHSWPEDGRQAVPPPPRPPGGGRRSR